MSSTSADPAVVLQAKKWRFTRPLVEDAPDHPGVYALWDGERLLYLGCAKGAETLREKLIEHFENDSSGCPRPTHYSWEIARQPLERASEIARQLDEPGARIAG